MARRQSGVGPLGRARLQRAAHRIRYRCLAIGPGQRALRSDMQNPRRVSLVGPTVPTAECCKDDDGDLAGPKNVASVSRVGSWIRREAASGVGFGIRIFRTPSSYAAETTSAEVPAGSRTCRTKLP
jgi:hypothetical protein